MERSKVYFTNFHTTLRENLQQKLSRLLLTAGMDKLPLENKYVAIKLHFGEPGNLAYLRPNYARTVVDLVKQLGGPALSGVGFAMGINRLIDAMRASGVTVGEKATPTLYIASMGAAAAQKAFAIAARFRDAGLWAESDIVGRSLKAQMKYADKLGAQYTLILGDSELESGKAQLKNMQTSEQTEVDIDSFVL